MACNNSECDSEAGGPAKCGRCEVLPDRAFTRGRLLLKFPLGHSSGKFRHQLNTQRLQVVEGSDYVELAVDREALQQIARIARETFSRRELHDTRMLLLNDGEAVSIDSWWRVETLEHLCGRVAGEWVHEVLADNRLTAHFHPILALSEPMELFAYECLMRGTSPQGLIGPGPILSAARDADLMFFLDRAARITAIREAARHGVAVNLFINFTPTSIYDPAFCLRTTTAEIKKAGFKPEQIVFEVIESEEIDDVSELRRILDYYRERGFRVALDDLGAGFASLNLLHELRPDFVKLDMALVREVHTDPYKAVIAAKLIEASRTLGIKVVAEGIEKAGELDWVHRQGVDYVQGFYFAKPATPPPQPDAARMGQLSPK